MPYPSLLWKRSLSAAPCPSEIGDDEGAIPENVPVDLYLHESLRPITLRLMRIPCGVGDILYRQTLLSGLIGHPEAVARLTALREQVDILDQLTGRLSRSTLESERVLLFPAAVRQFYTVADAWMAMPEQDGPLGAVAAYFRAVLAEDALVSCREAAERLRETRDPSLKLILRGGQLYAVEGGTMRRDTMENAFRAMGLADAIPTEKHPTFATPSVMTAYASVYAGYYARAEAFYARWSPLFTETYSLAPLARYLDEITVILDLTAYFNTLDEAGYPLCYPMPSADRRVSLDGMCDPSLLRRQIRGADVVPNEVRMAAESDGERLHFFILSGANGGGKTTYLRALGLAILFFITGCPVVAKRGSVYPFTALYAHFPANESFENSGRFVHEAERADAILEKADADTFALFNETYSGTDEEKSEAYAARLAETLYSRGTFGVFVTHIHALTGGKIPTLAAVIDEADDNRRTYKIRRVGGTRSSFAADVLEKYRLDAASIAQRLRDMGMGGYK